MKTGQKIKGIYQGSSFSGTISHIEPCHKKGYKNAKTIYINFDKPITIVIDTAIFEDVNQETGRIVGSGTFGHSPYDIEID